MTYALVDNATLTAVQRLAGQIVTRSQDSVDTDICAMENLVQAILFYDEVIAIDDYKPEHVIERKDIYSFIRFIDPVEFKLNELETQAEHEIKNIKPQIRGGKIVNQDFSELLELLKIHITCTWDLKSSIYHLNLKNLTNSELEFEKYGQLAASIFSELSEAKTLGKPIFNEIELVDRYGVKITKGYKIPNAHSSDGQSTGEASIAIKCFIAALTWIANRTLFYTFSSKYLQADCFLYPIRQSYQLNYLAKNYQFGFNYTKNIINNFSSPLNEDVLNIHRADVPYNMGIVLPMLTAWLCQQTNNPAEIINAALQLKDKEEFLEIRDILRSIKNLYDQSETADANKKIEKIKKSIEKTSTSIRIKYGLQTRQGVPLVKLIRIYNACAEFMGQLKMPEIDVECKLPEFLYNIRKPHGFCALYRNICNDLSTSWALGEVRDILGSKVIIGDQSRNYNPKKEEIKYKDTHSYWKSPM